MMLEFARPWALALAPLPLVAWYLLPASPAAAALRVPAGVWRVLQKVAANRPPELTIRTDLLLLTIGWLALLVAVAGPHVKSKPLLQPTGRDLIIALDLSASMAGNISENGKTRRRIDVVYDVIEAFLRGRRGDRVGLIGFASKAYLIAPLTFDLDAVAQMMRQATIGLPGRRTDIGQAIGLAIQVLRDKPPAERVLIVVSDGETNLGELAALDAAVLARGSAIKVHTIGFAEDISTDSKRHLAEIAERAAGRSFTADTPGTLAAIADEIDRQAPVAADRDERHLRTDLSWLPTALAFIVIMVTAWRELRGA